VSDRGRVPVLRIISYPDNIANELPHQDKIANAA
jgi:hypothetical protein